MMKRISWIAPVSISKTISFPKDAPSQEMSKAEKALRPLLPQLTNLFTDPSAPDQMTDKAGESLYRFFT